MISFKGNTIRIFKAEKAHKADLQADGHVDSAAERGGDGPGREAEAWEELGEGVAEGDARTLFCDDDARPDARQVDAAALKLRDRTAEAFRAKLHHAWMEEGSKITYLIS